MNKAKVIQRALLTPEEVIAINDETDRRCHELASDSDGNFSSEEMDAIYFDGEKAKLEKMLAKLLDLKQPCLECQGAKGFGSTTNSIGALPGWDECESCHGTGLSDLPVVGILKAHQAFPVNIKEHLDAAPDYLKETVVESPRDLYLKYLGGYEAQHDMLKAGFKAMEE